MAAHSFCCCPASFHVKERAVTGLRQEYPESCLTALYLLPNSEVLSNKRLISNLGYCPAQVAVVENQKTCLKKINKKQTRQEIIYLLNVIFYDLTNDWWKSGPGFTILLKKLKNQVLLV